MARYFLVIKTHSRTKGVDIMDLAAQQSPGGITDTTGTLRSSNMMRPVVRDFILAPVQAPVWIYDRVKLWTAVDTLDKRKDSQLCRSIQLLMPAELSRDQQELLLRDFVQREFVSLGMVVDCALWLTQASTYATILLCNRSVTPEGLGFKDRSWNNRRFASVWRKAWEDVTNSHLAQAGVSADKYIDRRSKEAQALDGIDIDDDTDVQKPVEPMDEF